MRPASVSVELVYLPTRADMAEALRARTGFPTRRWRLALTVSLITAAVLMILLMLAAPTGVTVPMAAALCPILGGLAGGWVNHLYRVRQITRFARSQGDSTMRADENGIDATTGLMTTTIPWSSFRHYIETANLFILVIDDTVGGMVLLPKRGLLDGADVDGLHAVVTRHLAPHPSRD